MVPYILKFKILSIAFISETFKSDFLRRVYRKDEGKVFPLNPNLLFRRSGQAVSVSV